MKLEQIHEMWAEDGKIDPDPLSLKVVSGDIPYLHSKYYKILSLERMMYQKMLGDHNTLKVNVFNHLHGKLTDQELKELGWKPFNIKMLSKIEEDINIEGHPAYIESVKKLALQKEKIVFLEDVIKSINSRQYLIRNLIELHKFTNGIN